MSDPVKIDAVRTYLRMYFPHHEITDKSRGANGHDFKMVRSGSFYLATFKRSFLDDHAPDEIPALLQQWQVERAIKTSATSGVIVGNGGPCVAWPDAPPS
ncbi:MAG: hypothetical protein EPO02_03650 [Nitrospirae bacterium]|nr:MAG: hypothetical protein EPO02_03650 [Nitrospirota bacterium]